MFEKFTERARKVMSLSRQEAQRLGSGFIDTEHMLLGILLEGGGGAVQVIKNLNVDMKRIRLEIEKLITPSQSLEVMLGQLPFSPGAKRVIELSGEAAVELGQDVIGTEHLLLGLLKESKGIAAQVLINLGLKLDDVRVRVQGVLGTDVPGRAIPLNERNLSTIAQGVRFRHLVDRPAVAARLLPLLQQGDPIALVGSPEVGKTSIILAMARGKAGGFEYSPLDHRLYDPFDHDPLFSFRNDPFALFVPEGELLVSSRCVVVEDVMRWKEKGVRLILEFRDEGFKEFSARYPELARELVPVNVDLPDEAETWRLLEAARGRLFEATKFMLTDDTLREANRVAAQGVRTPPAPWSTIIALWKAVPIQERLRAELAKSFDPNLSLEAIRAALSDLIK